ncbi:XrtA/PEP-CTERM system histidine kinase PrsK [Sabulicella rubraurantiaca]|uniref:XrtA/PEP-CTERM system histidine kinase PrsK n=1 Tax=Sabulicella rubraurantiaca TaxID=2811429 RepID=UPI001A967520|nr:XrtA/PEP-CTERM system histidine kinase PrsK [Sabulicella rubraurantiaca]
MIATLHGVAALAAAVVALGALAAGRGRHIWPPFAAGIAAAIWAGAVVLNPDNPLGGSAGLLEVLRSGVWGGVLLLLHWRLGTGSVVRGFAIALVLVLSAALAAALPLVPLLGDLAPHTRLALALLLVLIAENLARNSGEAAGWHLWPPAIALGGLGAFDVMLYSIAALSGGVDARLVAGRALLAALALPLLVLAARRDRRWARATPSHEVAFHGATLLVAGAFLLGAGAVGSILQSMDTEWGGAAQVAILAGATLALAVLLSARSVRSRIHRWVARHFLAARYDYRREWLRAVATLSGPGSAAAPNIRAIRAIADPVDVPAGTLLLRDSGPDLLREAEWNHSEGPDRLEEGDPVLARLTAGEVVILPQPAAYWVAVPLMHHAEGLLGAILLAPPRAPHPLEEEMAELLLTLGREVAMFLAERRAAERLAEGRRIADYARRFAFVAHDVKTVSSQLSMVLANAEAHMDDPEFQHDMLLTVRGAAQRIDALIARLRRDEAAGEAAGTGDPLGVAQAVASGLGHPVEIKAEGRFPPVPMAEEAFSTVLTHLLRNAAEASHAEKVIQMAFQCVGDMLEIVIADEGEGMSEAFLRDGLFRPLATTKPKGSGIGAWQARELVREAGGELTAESRLGEGTHIRITLPLSRAVEAA